jgi:hypothetical protein
MEEREGGLAGGAADVGNTKTDFLTFIFCTLGAYDPF